MHGNRFIAPPHDGGTLILMAGPATRAPFSVSRSAFCRAGRKIPRGPNSVLRGSHEIDGLRQRRRNRLGDARLLEAFPEHVPVAASRHAVALLEIEGENGVVGAR